MFSYLPFCIFPIACAVHVMHITRVASNGKWQGGELLGQSRSGPAGMGKIRK